MRLFAFGPILNNTQESVLRLGISDPKRLASSIRFFDLIHVSLLMQTSIPINGTHRMSTSDGEDEQLRSLVERRVDEDGAIILVGFNSGYQEFLSNMVSFLLILHFIYHTN
jgi:hypothetical protein